MTEKQQADEAAEKIFMPETTQVKFLDHLINMRPVPIAIAKELRRLPDKLAKALDAASGDKATTETIQEADITATDVYIDTVYKLLQFYKVEMPREDLETKTTIPELKAFVEEQICVQGEEDFLLAPLRRITEIYFPKPKKDETSHSS